MTGTLAVYTLIISFGICIGTPRVKKQSSIIVKKKHKSHKQINHKGTNIFNRSKFRNRTETKGNTHKHNTIITTQKLKLNKGKPTNQVVSGKTLVEKPKEEKETIEQNTGNALRKRPTRPKGFCTGMQAQLHSPIMHLVLLFPRAGFPCQHMQESL